MTEFADKLNEVRKDWAFSLTDLVTCHVADDNLWIDDTNFGGTIHLHRDDRKHMVNLFKKATFELDECVGRKFRKGLTIYLEPVDEGSRNMVVFLGDHSMIINIKQSVVPEFAIWLSKQRTYTEMEASKKP